MERNKNITFEKCRLFLSWGLIMLGVLILLLTFGNPLYRQIRYRWQKSQKVVYRLADTVTPHATSSATVIKEKIVEPIDRQFGIFIPKINANAKIYSEIDPFDAKAFLPVLLKGVAHAKGTAYPGQGSNIYLFAHSTDVFFNFGRYNAVFYLIGALDEGDEVDVYYQERLYRYYVQEKKVASPRSTKYLQPTDGEILILQTCYPPGTTLKRLIVIARPITTNF